MRTPKEIIDAVTDVVLAYQPGKARKKRKRKAATKLYCGYKEKSSNGKRPV